VVPPPREHPATPRASVSHGGEGGAPDDSGGGMGPPTFPPSLHAPRAGTAPVAVVGGGNLRISAPRYTPKMYHHYGPSRVSNKAFTTPPPTPVVPPESSHGHGTPSAAGAATPVAAPRRVTISFDEVAEAMQRRLESERRLAGAFGGPSSGYSSAVSSAAASDALSAEHHHRRRDDADIPREVLAVAAEPEFLVGLSSRQRVAATVALVLAAVMMSLGHVATVSARTAAGSPPAPVIRPAALFTSMEGLLSRGGGREGVAVHEGRSGRQRRRHPHVIPPRRSPLARTQKLDRAEKLRVDFDGNAALSNVTLRQFLTHPDGFHLAMAPAFFGFYAYFGALAAIDEGALPQSDLNCVPAEGNECALNVSILPTTGGKGQDGGPPRTLLRSAAGASAGAMAAVLLSAGIGPRHAADFASTLSLSSFADPPGWGAAMRGDKFESIMRDYLTKEAGVNLQSVRMEHARVPVAVTGFDLKKMEGKILSRGCMARAARASATFPGLFQPVGWHDDDGSADVEARRSVIPQSLLIDGGVADPFGLVGLSALHTDDHNKRVLNFVVGSFGSERPPGPSAMPDGVHASEVVSVSIVGTPKCGPWAMENGPRAAEAARGAIEAVMDVPMYKGREDGHYELHVDAAAFVPP